MAIGDRNAGDGERRGVRRRSAGVAAVDVGTGPRGEERGCRRTRPRGTHDVDPLPDLDRAGGARRLQAGAHGRGAAQRHPAPPCGAASTCASSSSIAAAALSRLFADRSPAHRNRRTTGPPAPATATYVRPTGLAAVPPSGPATPVTATATSVPSRRRAPSAIATATCAETAPCAANRSSPTPRIEVLISFA